MNDDNLERELRSQRGPREAGYSPAALPMSLEDGAARNATPSRLGRTGLLVGVGVAGALAVAVVASILSGPGSGPEVGSGSTAPSAEASSPALPTCGVADVAFGAEPWGGAAGSRGTTVRVTLAEGRYSCTLSQEMAAEIRDENGELLVSGTSVRSLPRPVPPLVLEPGAAFTTGIAWSNWCGDAPTLPVKLSLQPSGWTSPVSVDVPAGTDPVPQCSGAAEPSSLSVTWLEPAP